MEGPARQPDPLPRAVLQRLRPTFGRFGPGSDPELYERSLADIDRLLRDVDNEHTESPEAA